MDTLRRLARLANQRRWFSLAVTSVLWVLVHTAAAQELGVATVDDSPWALQTLRQAEDQSASNPGEAARLIQSLLERAAGKLVPISDDQEDQLTSVRQQVHALLRSSPAVLERFRQMHGASAQALLDRGDLELAASLSLLTPAGLEAQLRLAQMDLEAGRFHSARTRLHDVQDHPDLTGPLRTHYDIMTGMSAAAIGDAVSLDASLRALEKEATPLARDGSAAIERFQATYAAGSLRRASTVLDAGRTSTPSQSAWQWIWSVESTGTLWDRLMSAPEELLMISSREREARRRDASLVTGTAAILDSTIFVNEGYSIRALDRYSHREKWAQLFEPGLPDRDTGPVGDMSLLSLEGNTLIALTGFAFADQRTGDSSIVRLDARDGRVIWQVDLRSLPGRDDLSGLFPHGRPLIFEGSVYVMARKVTPQWEFMAYVVSLDLETGKLRWARFLASSSGAGIGGTPRAFSSIVEHEGDLYASTSIGAVARLRAEDGDALWVRRFPVPVRNTRFSARPWEIGGACVTSRGVLDITPDQSRVVLLNRETGDELESYSIGPAQPWGEPRYILAGGDKVFSVGSDVCAFSLDRLGEPLWRLSNQVDLAQRPGGEDRAGIRGRVQISQHEVIVPGIDDFLIVSQEDGSLLQRVALSAPISPGNPLLADAQVVVVSAGRIESYMPGAEAERMLRARIAESPDDPERALALLDFGIRSRNPALSMEAAALGQAALDRSPHGEQSALNRREFFQTLVELHESGVVTDLAAGDRLYGLMGAVANQPHQQVQHLLAWGDWQLAHGKRREAVESWQQVLSTPTLRDAPHLTQTVVRPGWAVALDRLRDAIAAHGPDMYAAMSDFAAQELDRLSGAPGDGRALVDLALTYPLAPAAIDALETVLRSTPEEAADLIEAADRLFQIHRADPAALARVVALLQNAAAAGGPLDLALDRSLEARRLHPELATADAEMPEAIRQPLRSLLGSRARVGDCRAVQATLIAGRLIPWEESSRCRAPADWCLVGDGGSIRRLDASLAEVWRTQIDPGVPRVVRFDGRRLLLVTRNDTVDVGLTAVDAQSGSVAWSVPTVAGALAPRSFPPIPRGSETLMPTGAEFNPQEIIEHVAGNQLIVARRNGDIVGISLSDGSVQWRRELVLSQIHVLGGCDSAVAVAGVGRRLDAAGGSPAAVPLVVLLNPQDGTVLRTIEPAEAKPVRWMTTARASMLLFGTDAGLEAYDLLGHRGRLFRNSSERATDIQGLWFAGWTALAAGTAVDLSALSLHSGAWLADAFRSPGQGDFPTMRLRRILSDEEGVVAQFEERVVLFTPDGRVQGDDANSQPRDYLYVLPAADGRLVVVNAVQQRQVETPEGGRRTEYEYNLFQLDRRQGGKLSGESINQPIVGQAVISAALIDGWLLMSTPTSVAAVPVPFAP